MERIERLDGILSISDYAGLHSIMFELIETFPLDIKEAVNKEKYKS